MKNLLAALHTIWTATWLVLFAGQCWRDGFHGAIAVFLLGLVFFLCAGSVARSKAQEKK